MYSRKLTAPDRVGPWESMTTGRTQGRNRMFQGMEYVYTVYKEQSFSRAADRLFVSQPSLSAAVKRVENKIGYPVFDRSTKPLRLTECGRRYIQAVEAILATESDFANFVNDWGELRTGRLVLGGSSLFSSWVLPPLMGEFARRFPLVKLELVEESTGKLEQLLKSGAVDLVIDNCELDPEIFDRHRFRKEHLLLAVPAAFPVNEGLEGYRIPEPWIENGAFLGDQVAPVPLEAFREEPFLVLKPENDTCRRAMDLCRQKGFKPRVLFELDQQMTSYNITCSGMGISFISDTLASRVPSGSRVVYYKLGGEGSSRSIYFYWKRGRYFSKAMKEFLVTVQPPAED